MTDQTRAALRALPLLSSSDLSLDLDRQKRMAKELRNAARAKRKDAVSRLRRHHPRFDALDLAALKLSDAQLTVAREAGLSSWSALKRHVEQIDAARQAIEKRDTAPDSDLPTLHIRCGNDIEASLDRAGFAGDFLMTADPICQGPISAGPHALEERAGFIAGEYPGENYEKNLKGLREAEEKLATAGDYGRIVLWFEHDPYDQLVLIKLLAGLRDAGQDKRKVELISLDRFPGISKFIGIGQLSPAALRHMFGQRQPVPVAAFDQARLAWDSLHAPTPVPFFDLIGKTPALPFLSGSIRRYLAELPSLENGLSFTEQSALEILADGPRPWSEVFREFMLERDPLPYHGDLMFLGTLLRLRDAATPALADDGTELGPSNWGKTVFSITAAGRELLAGRRDWKTCAPRERRHGGTECLGAPDWRWNRQRQRPETH
ncbi:DUF1835 domain-containing protein [Roseibium aggregatum]|uniref:DUF1835 domain-containing protein n=1 Tax=Roseibium aggregatum TaxID=187304 RepID=A0A939EGT3_9HYPH|nr:DUF1835 domain-containing protein [Roseibium aggregatum]MBN9672860.1 DUF1835 domain-containing protein [Roseibium aggregatum]